MKPLRKRLNHEITRDQLEAQQPRIAATGDRDAYAAAGAQLDTCDRELRRLQFALQGHDELLDEARRQLADGR